jgi:hypothetical protein
VSKQDQREELLEEAAGKEKTTAIPGLTVP